MTAILTREILLDLVKDLRERDPLLRNGVLPTWVCVINPAIVSIVKETARQYRTPDSVTFAGVNDLDQILGRRTFIIEDAPKNIEYMPESVMRSRYADYFKRINEWMKEQIEKTANDPET